MKTPFKIQPNAQFFFTYSNLAYTHKLFNNKHEIMGEIFKFYNYCDENELVPRHKG